MAVPFIYILCNDRYLILRTIYQREHVIVFVHIFLKYSQNVVKITKQVLMYLSTLDKRNSQVVIYKNLSLSSSWLYRSWFFFSFDQSINWQDFSLVSTMTLCIAIDITRYYLPVFITVAFWVGVQEHAAEIRVRIINTHNNIYNISLWVQSTSPERLKRILIICLFILFLIQ